MAPSGQIGWYWFMGCDITQPVVGRIKPDLSERIQPKRLAVGKEEQKKHDV